MNGDKISFRFSSSTLLRIVGWMFVGVLIYLYREPIWLSIQHLQTRLFPCARPLTYSIGTFDERFGMTKTNFLQILQEAEATWEKPTNQNLFSYSDTGSLTINLLYDERQSSTVRLQELGIVLHNDRATYDALKIKYASVYADYLKRKTNIEQEGHALEQQRKAYEAQVAYWNARGGAPKEEYEKLEAERVRLNTAVDRYNRNQLELARMVDTINDLVTKINELASQLNIRAETYNTINLSRGREFEEGEYIADGWNTSINIYQYDNKDKLIRVLAHEFGHALGLEHVDDAKAIMYRLNNGTNAKTTDADLQEIKRVCWLR